MADSCAGDPLYCLFLNADSGENMSMRELTGIIA